ncbi:MAG: hypothetical protein ABIG11_00775 [bacterium]
MPENPANPHTARDFYDIIPCNGRARKNFQAISKRFAAAQLIMLNWSFDGHWPRQYNAAGTA